MSGLLEQITQSIVKPLRLGSAGAVIAWSALACGDGGTGPDTKTPPPTTVEAVIAGPDALSLDCALEADATYSADQSTGTINRFAWRVDGDLVLEGSNLAQTTTLAHTFRGYKTFTIQLSALDFNNGVLDTATKTVSTTHPNDITACLTQSSINGKEALLIRPGEETITGKYNLSIPEVFKQAITNVVWRLQRENEPPTTIASGANVHGTEIEFRQEGTYRLSAEQFVGDNSRTVEQDVAVRQGEPLLEPGKIGIIRVEPPQQPGLYFMDPETGFVSGPVLSTQGMGSDAYCTAEHVILPIHEPNTAGVSQNNMFSVKHDGSDLTRIIKVEGNVWMPAVNGKGQIVVLDDTRWNYITDEIGILEPGHSMHRYLSGSATNQEFTGLRPSWSPDGNAIALGSVMLDDYPGGQKVVLYAASSGAHRPLNQSSPQQLYGNAQADEGHNGVDWDPLGEYVAYTVTHMDTGRQELALGRVDRQEVTILAEDVLGPIRWTPSGSHIIFGRVNPEYQSVDLMAISRSGGDVVNLTRAFGGERTIMDAVASYCH